MKNAEQVKRIEEMEKLLNAGTAAVDKLFAALEEFEAALPKIERLEKYYSSPKWKADYEADEKGELPPDIKRGVLSQDAVYDLLEQRDELLSLIILNSNKK